MSIEFIYYTLTDFFVSGSAGFPVSPEGLVDFFRF